MRRRSGFTLIELMIVLAIIAALAAILTPMGMNALNRANATQFVADVRNIRSSAQIYYFDHQSTLPTTWSQFAGYLDTEELSRGLTPYSIDQTNTTGNTFELDVDTGNTSILQQLEIAWTSDGLSSTSGNVATFQFTF